MPKGGAAIFGAVLAAVALVVVYLAIGRSGPRPGGPGSLVGAPAPSYTLMNLDAQPDALDRYRGHVVLMNLWASWCVPCRAEMPDLQRLYEKDRAKNLVVLGVNQGESLERARSFAASLGIGFPILLDRDQQYGRAYTALGLPTTIVVAPNGLVAKGFDGQLTFPEMEAAVAPLLAHPSQ